MRERVVLAGALAQRPGRAGHAWVFVNWIMSLHRLGHEVWFVDRMAPGYGDTDVGCAWVADVMATTACAERWSVLLADGQAAGRTRREVARAVDGAVLIDVMGYLGDEHLLAGCRRRIFVDIDPGFGQCWQVDGSARLFGHHDAYATVGLNVGRSDCAVPDLAIDWLPILPPVDLERWTVSESAGDRFTTVASWRGPFAPLEAAGQVHGLRVHSARRYADLPMRTRVELEMALDIDASDDVDRRRLLAGGWSLADPTVVAGDLGSYRDYVQRSRGELAIAKEAYVTMRTGWFSDRTACYLASGRPAIVSDTGLAGHLPLGEGLLVHDGVDSARRAVAEVTGDHGRHAKAARALAEEHFDGRRVVNALLERAA